MTKLWIGFAVVIAYGSLYPFDFQAQALDAATIQKFLDSCCLKARRGDILGNLVLFAPFGYLGMIAARDGTSLWSRFWFVCMIGGGLAFALQIAQIYLPSRDQSLQDVGWNVAGMIGGAGLGVLTYTFILRSSANRHKLALIPCLLIGCWLIYRLVPFVPSIDFASIKDSLRPLFQDPRIDAVKIVHDTVAWTVVAGLLRRARSGAPLDTYLPILIVGVFVLEVLIVNNVVHPSNVIGAVLALLLWWAVLRPVEWQAGGLAILLCVLLITSGLAPFVPRPEPTSMAWLPFNGLLGGSMTVNVLAICEKVFLYGSLTYFLWQTRLSRMIGTLVALAVVSSVEFGQTFVTGHSPEITDPLLIVLAALTMLALRRQEEFSTLPDRARKSNRQRGATGRGSGVSGLDGELVSRSINLRRNQADYLDELSQEMALDSSDVCRRIVELALRNEDATEFHDNDLADAAESLRAARGAGIENIGKRGGDDDDGAHDWTKRTIALDQGQIRALTKLSEDTGISLSRFVRHLIAAFIDQSMQDAAGAGRAPSRHLSARRPPSRSRAVTGSPTRKMKKPPANRKWWLAVGLGGLAAAGLYFSFSNGPSVRGPAVITSVPWAGRDANIIFDHHSHTVFSDGRLTPSALVDLARDGGCNVLAITDHSDTAGTASGRQFSEIRELRQQNPGFLLFAGVEINMPSYGEREHANVIVDPAMEEEVLPRLRDAAEGAIAEALAASRESGSDQEFLRLAASYHARGDRLLMIYNHPSRKDPDAFENYADIIRWNSEAPLFIGFAGAPGHQNKAEPGNYRAPIFTKDRWDPVVAEVGGTWDRLLSEGHQLWGAIAGSDYHNGNLDKPPCDFSRTHIAASDLSYQAVLKALRAGTFWADHGQILRQLSFSAEIAGLEVPVYPGSIADLGNDPGAIVVRATLVRGPGAVGAPMQVEFIGNCRTGETELLAVEQLDPAGSMASAMIQPRSTGADNESCFIRARVRLDMDPHPDLMAYTNPIRFRLP